MSNLKAIVAAGLLPGAAVLAATGAGSSGAEAGSVRCEIQVSGSGSGVTLEGVVYAKSEIAGSYQLRVSQSGSGGGSNINQGGGFSAGPGGPSHLGTVMLGGGGSYTASLKVTWDGGSTACSERVSG